MDKVYGTPKESINSMVRDFLSMPGVEIHQGTDFNTLLSYWPLKINDFGDALIAATAKAIKGSLIITFDEKFKSALKRVGLESL